MMTGLLRPVNESIALLAAFFHLVCASVAAASMLGYFAALPLLGRSGYLKAFDAQQLQALAYLFLKLRDIGFDISLVFFGFNCIFLGYLLFHARYFPRFLGV